MLKVYYTLEESAQYLSTKSGEPISVQDVLEFAGDNKLNLCANYNGDVCSFWKELFGSRYFWAEEQPFWVRGTFSVEDSTEFHISRSSTSFRLSVDCPVEIKSLSLEGVDLLQVYMNAIKSMASKQPTLEAMQQQAVHRGITIVDSDYQYFETTVEFGGFSSGAGWPEILPVLVHLNDCLVRRADLDSLLESCETVGGMHLLFKHFAKVTPINISEFPRDSLDQSTPSTINEILHNQKVVKKGVTVSELNLQDWPLVKGDADSLLNAINRPAKWVKGAISGKYPKLVNPALLAFKIQDKTKNSQIAVAGLAKKLGIHIAEHFPEFYEEYEGMIDYGK